MARRTKKITQEEAAAMVAENGYELVGQYTGADQKVLVRCPRHDFQKEVFLKNVRGDRGMVCCYAERKSKMMLGNKNSLGKPLSDRAKAKLSATNKGRKQSVEHIEKKRLALTGKKRSKEFSERQSAWLREAAKSIDTIIRRAATGKTAGKPGAFYVAQVGDLLKLGSTNRTIDYRISRLRTAEGDASLLMQAMVDDAGAYEAAMLNRCRDHWAHGEFFHPTLLSSLGPQPLS